MRRREAVQRIVELAKPDPFALSLREVSAQLAVHCETHPHEFVRNHRCAWCGIPESEAARGPRK